MEPPCTRYRLQVAYRLLARWQYDAIVAHGELEHEGSLTLTNGHWYADLSSRRIGGRGFSENSLLADPIEAVETAIRRWHEALERWQTKPAARAVGEHVG